MNYEYDIFIIGGGINGTGIARDAAGRNLRVCLIEKNEIGEATSSWSSKLIHGGLRYLENYEFKLVRESLREREIINYIASSITKQLPFVIPHTKQLRPAWLIKCGLFIYDYLGGNSVIPKSKTININQEFPNILKDFFVKGFLYYDLQVDDKKLTKFNAFDASKNNALILKKTKIINIERFREYWKIYLANNKVITSKIIINASGPWVNEVSNDILRIPSNKSIKLVKGSHIIVNKLYEDEVAFTLQNKDKRIIFVIPYKDKYSLIGTTEVIVKSPNNSQIDQAEIQYLLNAVNYYLKKQLKQQDIVDTYSGIRTLVDNFKEVSKISRDYTFDLNTQNQLSPLLNIYGGKLTTYRKLSERALNELKDFLPKNKSKTWTDKTKLKTF
tara:strand:- start:416 stop:1576 length:1161 start_codon:yes stop_codon:yes gene_type:complete